MSLRVGQHQILATAEHARPLPHYGTAKWVGNSSLRVMHLLVKAGSGWTVHCPHSTISFVDDQLSRGINHHTFMTWTRQVLRISVRGVRATFSRQRVPEHCPIALRSLTGTIRFLRNKLSPNTGDLCGSRQKYALLNKTTANPPNGMRGKT